MFRKLLPILALFAPIAAWGQSSPCPVGTNGASVVLVNDSTTGTGANKVVALTSAGNAILYPHAQSVGAVGVAYNGAGAVPNSGVCVQQTGSIPVIADGAVTIQHWVTTSTTTDGNIHDTGTACTANPPAGEVIGCAVTASSGAGVAALIALKNFIYATGVTQSGTAISGTTCVIIASGTNTIQCGTAADTGTYFQPKEILDMQANNTAESSTTAAGTYTVGNLACVTATNTVGDCASAAANQAFIGINLAKNGTTPETAKSGSAATVKSSASVTWTAGDKICTDAANAALSVDNSTTDCPSPQRQVGIVKTTDGGNTTSHTVDLMFSGTNPSAIGAIATVSQLSQTAAVSTFTLCAAATCGNGATHQYRVDFDIWESGTACSSVGSGAVGTQLTWTDESGTAHSAIAMGFQTTGSWNGTWVPSGTTLANVNPGSGSFVFSTNGTIIQAALTYAACTTGTLTYNIRYAVFQLQ